MSRRAAALTLSRDHWMDALLLAYVVASSITLRPQPAIIVVCCMVAVALYALVRRPAAIDPLIAIIALNVIYWLFSAFVLAGVPPENLLRYAFWRWPGRVFFYYAPFVFFLAASITPERARRYLLWALIFASALGTIGVLQMTFNASLPFGLQLAPVTGAPAGEGTVYVRLLTGLATSHSAAGGYFGLIAVAWLSLVAAPRGSRWPLPRAVLVVLVACTLVALVLTGSRAAYIGLAAAMIYQAIRWMREGRQRQIVAVSLIGAVAVLIALSVSVTVEATQHVGVLGRVGHGASDADIATRLREWRKTMPLIEASPFVGIGFSRWADVLPDRLTFARVDIHDNRFAGFRGLVWLARRFPVNNADISAHSSYMTRLSEIGVIGVLLLGWFWIAVWRRERSLGAERGWDLPELAAAAQACIVFVAVCAFFEDGFGAPGIGLPLALIVGLSLASRRSSRPPGRAQTEDSGGIAVVALGRAAGR